MAGLEKRLSVRLDADQFARLRRLALVRKRTIAAIVREAIDEKVRRERLAAIEDLGRINAPVSDWEQMEREIDSGYE